MTENNNQKTKSIISLTCGIVSLLVIIFPILVPITFISGTVGAILYFYSEKEPVNSMRIAGIITSIVGLALNDLFIWVIVMGSKILNSGIFA